MNLFDQWVEEVLQRTPELSLMRPVVEKELLHHDILRILQQSGLLKGLVFMGGTCLRACYGSQRLSEDLDFYGGLDFSPEQLQGLASQIQIGIGKKYGFNIRVHEPRQDRTQVRTWKVIIQTHAERPDIPSQRIHLDICLLDAMDIQPMVLRNPYGLDVGTSGLILRAASREEIYVDKIVALALRVGRIKFRDVWDLHWLRQQNTALRGNWILPKVAMHGHSAEDFRDALLTRLNLLSENSALQKEGWKELSRFLLHEQISGLVDQPDFWRYLCSELRRDLSSIL